MERKAIEFTFTKTVVLRDLWYDEGWHKELLEDGWSEEGALREMLREGWREDWTSIVQEMLESDNSYADEFVDSCSNISVVNPERV